MVLRLSRQTAEACLLMNDPSEPSAIFLLNGGMLCSVGESSAYPTMFADLLEGRVAGPSQWPPQHLRKSLEWQAKHEGYCSLFLNTIPVNAHEAALNAGFLPHPEDKGSPPASLYYFRGEPRFSGLVRHPCRLGKGDELLELVKQGISYDEQGRYTRMCLQNGPSFVCEVDGEPVCWSCTHLNGTMGMIYTPEEHRRKGYAKSLAAIQIDHMLEKEGFACCHIVEGNTASEEMVLGLGAQRDGTQYCWRSVLWPENRNPLRA